MIPAWLLVLVPGVVILMLYFRVKAWDDRHEKL
jgi:hypothetical protein